MNNLEKVYYFYISLTKGIENGFSINPCYYSMTLELAKEMMQEDNLEEYETLISGGMATTFGIGLGENESIYAMGFWSLNEDFIEGFYQGFNNHNAIYKQILFNKSIYEKKINE